MRNRKAETEFQDLETAESLAEIRKIADSVWPETFREILSPEQIVYMMKMMYSPEVMERELAGGYRFFLLKIDGIPAGYVSWSAYRPEDTAKAHKIYLLSSRQGAGYGSLMLEETLRRAGTAGFRRMVLNVNKHNGKAIACYRRNGFSVRESVKIDIGNGFFMDDYVMGREL